MEASGKPGPRARPAAVQLSFFRDRRASPAIEY